jgi:drug/metabolite transporter (DMT)-like permease
MITRRANLLLLHLVVFIWGFTGILGKEISLEAWALVWWRVVMALFAIGIFALVSGRGLRPSPAAMLKFAGVGILTAAHWVCFFSSIKASNISVALVVLSTTSFFVSLVSPFIRKEKFRLYELLLGILVIAGLLLIFKFEVQYTTGIVLSLLASVFAAIFSSINSTLVREHTATRIAFWEMLFAAAGVSVFLAATGKFDLSFFSIGNRDLYLLLILGIVCTGFAFIGGIEVMKVLSPFTCALTINLEPVYTIGLALLFYGESEWMSLEFYVGALVILSTLFIDAWLKRRTESSTEGIHNSPPAGSDASPWNKKPR